MGLAPGAALALALALAVALALGLGDEPAEHAHRLVHGLAHLSREVTDIPATLHTAPLAGCYGFANGRVA